MSESEWEEAVVLPVMETPLPFLKASFHPTPCPSCGEEGWLPLAHFPPKHISVCCKYCFHAKLFEEE